MTLPDKQVAPSVPGDSPTAPAQGNGTGLPEPPFQACLITGFSSNKIKDFTRTGKGLFNLIVLTERLYAIFHLI